MRRKIVIGLGALVCLFLGLWFWPSPAINRSNVDPALLRLVPPFSKFWTGHYMDGGSIGIQFVDSRGQLGAFALPIAYSSGRSYPRLFVGAPHTSKPGAVEIPFTIDSRRMLISWIETHRNFDDSSDLALLYLRGNIRDYARLCGHAATSLSMRLLR